MECGLHREKNETKNSSLSNAFMFTEEQITKQLVDMREQTDFMRKFRGALGIALREIKTLRTTQDHLKHDTEGSVPRKRHSSCTLPSSSADTHSVGIESSVTPVPAQNVPCVCADFGQADLAILRDYLAKMTLAESSAVDAKGKSSRLEENSKCRHHENAEKLKDSGNLIENSIRHIEKLKGHVVERNKAVIRLCQQLTQARLVRIRREAKLDEKLKEIKEWKEKYEKMKKQNEKQVKITKGLRLTLNAEKQRVKTYENMARGLEETKRAFEALKAQAGKLMILLGDKDREIAGLTEKIEDIEASKSKDSRFVVDENMPAQNRMMSPIHGVALANSYSTDAESQTDFSSCNWCDRSRMEIDALRGKYDRLYADFEHYRRSHNAWEESQQNPSNSLSSSSVGPRSPASHPYGRRRMHAPYTSPNSYRRVSRPPLRRRLSQEAENQINAAASQPHPVNHSSHQGPLSPIEEYGESHNHSRDGGSSFTSEIGQNNQNHGEREASTYENAMANNHQSPIELLQDSAGTECNRSLFHKIPDPSPPANNIHPAHAADEILPPVSREIPYEATSLSPKHDSGISSIHDNEELLLLSSVKSKTSPQCPEDENAMCDANSKRSYLEVGTSGTPPPNSFPSPVGGDHDQPQLCLNSFIRYNDDEDTASEQSSLPHDDLEVMEEPNSENSMISEPETSPLSFGVVWHPALINSEAQSQSSSDIHNNCAPEKDGSPRSVASNPLLRHNGVVTVQEASAHKNKKSGRRSRVTYKGHKIDVTDFSIHAFRDIIWSLDGGPDSADDFIKFLASLAKKLNASPKWAGKHSMGSPEDWLALRGLY